MSLHEAHHEPIDPPVEDMAVAVDAAQYIESEQATTTQVAPQAYEYTRQDGTVERAANREEAIKLCPVLGRLALQDPQTANLLLDIASLGQAKLAERGEPPKPQAHKQTELVTKPEKTAAVVEPVRAVRLAEQTSDLQAAAVVAGRAVQPPRLEKASIPQPLHYVAAREALLHQERQRNELDRIIASDEDGMASGRQEVSAAVEQTRPVAVPGATIETAESKSRPIARGVPRELVARAATEVVQPDERVFVNLTHGVGEDFFVDAEVATSARDVSSIIELSVDPFELPVIEAATSVGRETVGWAEVLNEEPLELCVDFTRALQVVEQAAVTSESTAGVIGVPPGEEREGQPTPTIVTTVTEQLTEIVSQEWEAAAPAVADVVEILRSVAAQHTTETDPRAAEQKLETLTIALFEHLGIAYNADDVESFVGLVLGEDFQPRLPEADEADSANLTDGGTHEAKLPFVRLVGRLADVEDKALRMLGGVVLFCVAKPQLAA